MTPTTRATLIGGLAVLLWSALALLTVMAAPVPPLLLNALCFGIGGLAGLIWVARTRGLAVLRAVPLSAYAFMTAGLFGYHALFFSALRLAPPAEAGLVNYMWPLLIVLGSGLFPGERLRAGHVVGALIAAAGAALIVGGGVGAGAGGPGVMLGYALALAAAFVWAGYSLGSRRLAAVPTAAVAVACVATAILAGLAHLAFEATVWPQSGAGWLAVLALGLGPVGLAFYAWDTGVKRGNIQLLGTMSYAAPLLSTAWLVLAGQAQGSARLALAALLITAGAFLAARAGRG